MNKLRSICDKINNELLTTFSLTITNSGVYEMDVKIIELVKIVFIFIPF